MNTVAIPNPFAAKPETLSSEGRLVVQAQGGSTEAFEQLMKSLERQVLGTSWKMLGNLEDAKDACQEVFLRLYRGLARIDPERSLGAWLHRVTVNVCRDQGRRRSRRREKTVAEGRWESLADPAAEADPERRAQGVEMQRHLAAQLRELPERESRALLLRDVQGLSTREVAERLGTSEVTVRSQICRARLKLRRWRDRRGEEAR